MSARRLSFVILGAATMAPAFGQVPDLLNTFDAGGRAMGTGGALYPTSSDTLSSYYNPAGLGYVNHSTLGVVIRNLPNSESVASGEFNDEKLDTKARPGKADLTHFGAVFPWRRGAFGLSYTVGGYIDDLRSGDITVGGLTVTNYLEQVRARTDFFTLAYGQPSGDGALSWGIGAQFVQQSVHDQIRGDIDGGGTLEANPNGTTFGIAGIVGFQYTPRGQNMTLGASYRSQVDLSHNDQTSPLLDKIPARLLGGIAYRQDGMRGGKDFVVYGLNVAHYFKVNNGTLFKRTAQTTVGAGFEYNYLFNGARVPFRFGYNFIPSGGVGYGDRNSLTFGIGYRPLNNAYTLDLNFAAAQQGGFDFALGATWRIGNR